MSVGPRRMLDVDRLTVVYRPPKGLAKFVVKTAVSEPLTALRQVSLAVERGEVLGIVGPNGAGKSTLLKAIASLVMPTEGGVKLDGVEIDPSSPQQRVLFGLSLPDDRSFYWRLTGRQNLEYFAAMVGLDRETARRRVDEVMLERNLSHRDKALFGYSSGMLAQLGLGRALLHDPPLLILDEPTRSLDPLAAEEFCALVRTQAGKGKAIVLATHRLEDVLAACDRVLALVDGRVVWTGSTSEIDKDVGGLGAHLRKMVATAPDAEGL